MKTDRGITLIELIIAVTIFTFFTVCNIQPQEIRAKASGKYTRCQSNLKNIGGAFKSYAKDHNGNYPEKMEMLTPDYLRTIPTCASSGTNKDYIYSYRCSPDHQTFTFYCAGNYHESVGLRRNFPQYNRKDGMIAR